MSFPENVDSLTVNMALRFDSSEVMTSSIERVGGSSSSVIVNRLESSVIFTLFPFERLIVAVSLISSIPSSRMGTINLFEVSPAAIVDIPDVAI